MTSKLASVVAVALFAAASTAGQPAAASQAEAAAARWVGGYLEHEDELRVLAAEGERTGALTVLRAHQRSSEIRLRTLALALLYQHAERLGVAPAERERLRVELQATAEDVKAPGFARNEACRVLLTSDWTGRYAWYEQLLGDATLRSLHDAAAARARCSGRSRPTPTDGCRASFPCWRSPARFAPTSHTFLPRSVTATARGPRLATLPSRCSHG